MKIVYMHGIGKQPDKELLKLEWDYALFDRDMEDKTAMAYWADLSQNFRELANMTNPLNTFIPPTTHTIPNKSASTINPAILINSLNTIISAGAINTTSTGGTAQISDQLKADLKQRLLEIANAARISKAIHPILPETADPLLKSLLTDVINYFFDNNKRDTIKARFRELLFTREPLIVIAHGMGTVITYDVLRDFAEPQSRLHLYITLGSPIGLQTIQQNIRRVAALNSNQKLPFIAGRSIWSNFSGIGDPLSANSQLANDIHVPANGHLCDKKVVNTKFCDGNPHSFDGYLALDEVRSLVRTVFNNHT